MTGAEFKAIVEFYGESNIISIGFDNSSVTPFLYDGMFSLANNYVDAIECLIFLGHDMKGLPFHIVKHVENVQSIIVKDNNVNKIDYDRYSIRG